MRNPKIEGATWNGEGSPAPAVRRVLHAYVSQDPNGRFTRSELLAVAAINLAPGEHDARAREREIRRDAGPIYQAARYAIKRLLRVGAFERVPGKRGVYELREWPDPEHGFSRNAAETDASATNAPAEGEASADAENAAEKAKKTAREHLDEIRTKKPAKPRKKKTTKTTKRS